MRVHGHAPSARAWLARRTRVVRAKAGSDVGDDGVPSRRRVLERIAAELEDGGSVFWVFPLVDDSEHFEGMGSATAVRISPGQARRGQPCMFCALPLYPLRSHGESAV